MKSSKSQALDELAISLFTLHMLDAQMNDQFCQPILATKVRNLS